MRTAFIQSLTECARSNENIWLLTADLGFSVLERFRDEFPDRFINVGIAEQNMIGIASGLALSGKTVFVYSIANFPTIRCLEQIRNDVCYHNLNVKIVAVGGGLSYGTLGYTHHGIEDLALMRALPNISVVAPGDPTETGLLTELLTSSTGPAYLRIGKAGEPVLHKNLQSIRIGDILQLVEGKDITILTTGGTLEIANNVALKSNNLGLFPSVYSVPFLKPINHLKLTEILSQSKLVVTVEEHKEGGLGTVISEFITTNKITCELIKFRLPENIIHEVGSQVFLRDKYGLNDHNILTSIISFSKANGLT
jgi:transketolase